MTEISGNTSTVGCAKARLMPIVWRIFGAMLREPRYAEPYARQMGGRHHPAQAVVARDHLIAPALQLMSSHGRVVHGCACGRRYAVSAGYRRSSPSPGSAGYSCGCGCGSSCGSGCALDMVAHTQVAQ